MIDWLFWPSLALLIVTCVARTAFNLLDVEYEP